MPYFTIAFRNIVKNLRKNSLTVLMISFGVVALTVYGGSNAHMFGQFRDGVIRLQYGHFQLHAAGFLEHGTASPYGYLIENFSRIEPELLSNDDIDYVAPRLSFTGIAAGDDRSAIVRGFGGRAGAERRMEFGTVSEGSFLPPESDASAGDFSRSAEGPHAVLGEGALGKTGASVGESVTVLANMKEGGASAGDFLITGAKKGFGENDALNHMLMVADLRGVQDLVGADDSVDTVIVHLKEGRREREAERAIAEFCGKHGLEYRRWDELAVFYARSREVFAMNERILTAIILVISVFIILNTLYMAYMERVREIGTMRAIGTRKTQVALIVTTEGVILSVLGCTLGVIAASAIALAVNACGGIYHPASVFNEEPFSTLITPEPLAILSCYGLFVCVSLVSSLVIAFRSLRIPIADSLRWN